MADNSTDITSFNTGDLIEIDFPARLREDGEDKPRTKFCVPLIDENNKSTEFWNFNTSTIVLTTSKNYAKEITTGVEIPEGEYDFIPNGTYIICSQVYTIPDEILTNGEKMGRFSDDHIDEIKLATNYGIGLNIQNIDNDNNDSDNNDNDD